VNSASCIYVRVVSNQFVSFEMIDVHNVLVHKLNIVSNPNRDIVRSEMDVISYRDLFADVQKSCVPLIQRFCQNSVNSTHTYTHKHSYASFTVRH